MAPQPPAVTHLSHNPGRTLGLLDASRRRAGDQRRAQGGCGSHPSTPTPHRSPQQASAWTNPQLASEPQAVLRTTALLNSTRGHPQTVRKATPWPGTSPFPR